MGNCVNMWTQEKSIALLSIIPGHGLTCRHLDIIHSALLALCDRLPPKPLDSHRTEAVIGMLLFRSIEEAVE